MPEIKVVIADDHPIFRCGLVSVIAQSKHIILSGEAENGEIAISLIREHKPDVAILDIEMPLLNGLEVCEIVRKENLPTRVMVLTLYKEMDLYESAINSGAYGYMLKDNAVNELIIAIETLARGEKYVSDDLKKHLTKRKSYIINDPIVSVLIKKLTSAEKNILLLIAEEKTSREIAAELFVSEKTIENHRYNIAKKLELEGGKNTLLKFALANKQFLK